MKKLLIFLTAAAMLCLASCDSDKQENPNDTAISEPVEEIPTEPVFMEYNQSDFAQINVAINKQESEPVLPVTVYDLSKVNYEKLISPCKLPENRNKTFEKLPSEFYDFVTGEYYEDDFNNYCDIPVEAFFSGFAVCGNKVAVYADFDELCYYNHCYKILEYDLKTEEVRELYSYSSADEGEHITKLRYYSGELYAMTERMDDTAEPRLENGFIEYVIQSDIYHVTDGKLEKLFSPDDFDENTFLTFFSEKTDRFILYKNGSRMNDDNETISEYSLLEYDTETGEAAEIFRQEENTEVLLNGDDIITTGKDDDKCTYIEGRDFRINTGIKGLQVKAAEGNRIIALTDDTIKTTLYTYDLDKMECYVSNVNGVSNLYLVDGNVLLNYGPSNTLLIPELGASFNMPGKAENMRSTYNGYDGGRLWFTSSVTGWSSGTDMDGNRSYYVKTGEAIGNLVIIGE